MIIIGNTALNPAADPKHEVMVEYLSAEDGYWLESDEWRADSDAYRETGLRDVRFKEAVLVDFSSYRNEALKLEMKYLILYGMKHKWKSPYNLQNMQKSAVRMLGEGIGSNLELSSFSQIAPNDESDMPDDSAGRIPCREYRNLRLSVIEFISELYDEREETEKDVWYALKIPGVKLSAAMKRQNPSMNFVEIPAAYRESVKRFMKRLVTRRSWSYCKEMLMYIRYFFRIYYENGYKDGFLEGLDRGDAENYLRWVADDYENRNATFRSKAVSFVRNWLDYIQIAEYPQAPVLSIERLIFEDDVPKRERASDTIEKVRYIPTPVIQEMDACIEQIEPAEMRSVYVLLRETGWRGTDVLNLRYDSCLQYIWNARENRWEDERCRE